MTSLVALTLAATKGQIISKANCVFVHFLEEITDIEKDISKLTDLYMGPFSHGYVVDR